MCIRDRYRAYGFREIERTIVMTPDGIGTAAVAMERPIDPA